MTTRYWGNARVPGGRYLGQAGDARASRRLVEDGSIIGCIEIAKSASSGAAQSLEPRGRGGNVVDGCERRMIQVVPLKTRRTTGKKLSIPIHPDLAEVLAVCEVGRTGAINYGMVGQVKYENLIVNAKLGASTLISSIRQDEHHGPEACTGVLL
jgi:hypothetical protein